MPTSANADIGTPRGAHSIVWGSGGSGDERGDHAVGEAARAVAPGNAAGILIYENRWAGPFVAAMRRSGAELVASGRLPATNVIAAVEALDSAR